jgi:hypothetical protein
MGQELSGCEKDHPKWQLRTLKSHQIMTHEKNNVTNTT